jgi:streptogramin lyase
VWILDATVGTVTVVDAESLEVRGTVRVGDDEKRLVFGADAAWLADGSANSVTRIDALTSDVTTFPMGGPVADVAVDTDPVAVWVLLARAK